ncbi:hypothetical protein PC9H_009185 [Pleurotus ostreatus]|uniref:Uncharacterized protein n=1 Tax=Pleurotus ostreatus TaxID=5322 RepID=A0A8H6ZU08_PLEOS|nr:uncharacterized protein PC9H_009185 [Pleurotus ostreatus]KAF7426816.1 hypothetical protein PC9H_009185 [Pleurotus ostreatus]
MPWATPEQLEYMSTKVLAYHATVKGTAERRKFNAEVRQGWSERWPLLDQHIRMFSSYFREELIKRGLVPRRKRKPAPKKPNQPKATPSTPPDAPARLPLAWTSHHQDTRSLEPTSELILATRSPVASTSFREDPRPVEDLILGLSITPRVTPPLDSSLHPPYSRSSTVSVERLLLQDVVSSPPPDGRERRDDETIAPLPRQVRQRAATRSLRFQLNLPGIEHDDVRLFVQDQRLAVCAHNSSVSYEWEMDLGGNILPDRVHGGIVSGDLRLAVTVEEAVVADVDHWVFTITNEWPW